MKTKELKALSGYVNVKEAAALLGVSEQTVRNLLAESKLQRTKFHNLTLIAKANIEAYKRNRK